MTINRIILSRKLYDFKEKLGKDSFTSIEFMDYLKSEGYDLDNRDKKRIMHWLSARLPSKKVEVIEIEDDKFQIRKINQYKF